MIQADDILISVRHEYAEKMACGEKTIELRRRRLRIRPGTTVWVYSKAPRATVDVSATVESVVAGSPEQLWTRYRHGLGISKSELITYLTDAKIGYAVVLKNVQKLDRRIPLSDLREHCRWFHPPQFFKRLPQNSPALKLLRNGLRAAPSTAQRGA